MNKQKSSRINKNSKINKKYRNKIILAGTFGLIIPLIIAYFLISVYYKTHFFSNTVINGVPTSNMNAIAVEDAIMKEVKAYTLTIQGRNGVSDTIYGSDIQLHAVFEERITDLLKKQEAFTWPSSLLKKNVIEVKTMLEFDEELLKVIISRLSIFDEENKQKPQNASISEYGPEGYTIVPEKPGTIVTEDRLYEEVKKAILALETTISLEEVDAYTKPEITSENPKLLKALAKMNKIAGAKITYEFGEDIEILDGSKISEWLSVDESLEVKLDSNGIKEYVDYIGKTYNSFGRTREFKTSYGKVLSIKGGDYGWWLNRPAEVEELTKLIRNGEQLTKTPVYYQTAQQYGKDDIGDTYVEVNITAQHLFFYVEGELIMESDFVSGNLSKDYVTPSGTYPVQYKENDATLVGEDYETPVKYWMPFNKNIGFHDANWRKEFGKDIYLTGGSHGCINMPPEAAKIMFEHIKRGVAVVVYELPGTENYEIDGIKKFEDKTNDGNKVNDGNKTNGGN